MFIEVMVSSYCMCLKYLNLALSHKTKHETKSNNNKKKKSCPMHKGLYHGFERKIYYTIEQRQGYLGKKYPLCISGCSQHLREKLYTNRKF